MPSGLVILAAYNKEDQFLVGNPQVSLFRSVYLHHSPFAGEYRQIDFNSRVSFGQTTITLDIPRDADLLRKMWLRIQLPELSGYSWTNNLGHALIKEIRLRAGEIILDRQNGEWMNIWGNLSIPDSKKDGYNQLIGRNPAYAPGLELTGAQELFIPLQFWFCRHDSCAFPLIALQHQKLQLELDLRPLEEIVVPPLATCSTRLPVYQVEVKMIGEYIYLDREEKRWFISRPQIYLIEQIQSDTANEFCGGTNLIRKELPFNGLLKEIIFLTSYRQRGEQNLWFFYSSQNPSAVGGGNLLPGVNTGDLSDGEHGDIILSAKIQYDSYDIVPELPALFYRFLQPFDRHTSTPDDFIYCYSWALHPENWQPSGHINMFRATNATLVVRKRAESVAYPTELRVYGLVYNVLKIMEGSCGLEFTYA
jgi:hypothetical protein